MDALYCQASLQTPGDEQSRRSLVCLFVFFFLEKSIPYVN